MAAKSSAGYGVDVLELWLVRHAESLGNLDGSDADTPLSPRGREQAAALAARLVGEVFDLALSSPLLRARETAAIALSGRTFDVEPSLREFVGVRERFVDVSRLDPGALRELLRPGPDDPPVETGRAFMARVRAWLAALPVAGRVVVFTHFGVVRECLNALFPEAARVQGIGRAAISRVSVSPAGHELVALDERRHLEAMRRD